MNLAIPTLTLIFLLAPGLAFRRGYFSGAFSQQYFKATFSDLLIATILPAVAIHILLFNFAVRYFYNIDANTLAILLSGTTEPQQIRVAFSSLNHNAKEICLYLLLASVISFVLGIVCKNLIRGLRYDRKYTFFQFQNKWHYLFTGEILDFPGQAGRPEDVDFVYIDALVDCQEGTVLYSGMLAEHLLSKDGGLDRIYLSDTRRRYLKNKDNGEEGTSYYEMPGNLFVIPYISIINLHITYYSIEVQKELKEQIDKVDIEAD